MTSLFLKGENIMNEENICEHCHEKDGKGTYYFYYLDRRDGKKINAFYCGDCGRKLDVKEA